jgi:hypothetical protein
MVTKDSGPHVKQSGRDAWLRDVSLFCKACVVSERVNHVRFLGDGHI